MIILVYYISIYIFMKLSKVLQVYYFRWYQEPPEDINPQGLFYVKIRLKSECYKST